MIVELFNVIFLLYVVGVEKFYFGRIIMFLKVIKKFVLMSLELRREKYCLLLKKYL